VGSLFSRGALRLALGKHLVGAPVGGVAAAGGVVLVQLAVADGHGGVRVGVAVDVEDQDVAGLAAVVACVQKKHAFFRRFRRRDSTVYTGTKRNGYKVRGSTGVAKLDRASRR
jgi:hypothetical protein